MRRPRFLIALLVTTFLAASVPAALALQAGTCVGITPTHLGTDRAETLTGTDGPDVILAGDGDDVILALGGDDLVCAGGGNDVVYGGDGVDRLLGGRGDDLLRGEAGNDLLVDGAGGDRLEGGPGNDHLAPGTGADSLLGGLDDDTLRGGAGEDVLDGGLGRDDLAGGPGADRLMRVLIRDTVSDSGSLDARGDTRWYRSLTLEPLGGTHLAFPNSVSGYDQRHTQSIEVAPRPGGLVLVERLAPEEYLLGIAEMPYSWHAAALRAQAIAARTYLANVLADPPRGVMAEFGFDICGSAQCQMYLGAGRAQVVPDGARWAAAVAATAGKILLYDGTPALAVYHSTAGATTRSNQDVWGGEALPYLQAVPVPAQDSPFADWSFDLRLDQLLAVLAADGTTFPAEVTAVTTEVTAPGDGPYRVRFQTTAGITEIPAGGIQSAVNTHGPVLYGSLLPAYRPDGKRYPQAVLSPTFTVSTLEDGTTVRFTGQGWGHQVGMPQYAAQAMALAGESTGAILNHFYTGLWPRLDPAFLPEEIAVGLAWDRPSVTLRAEYYVLRSPDGVVARGRDARFLLSAGERGWVVLEAP